MSVPGIEGTGAFEYAVGMSPSGVLVVDENGTVVLINREVERQFGYVRDELVGRPVDLVLPDGRRPIDDARRQALLNPSTAAGVAAANELLGRHKDGSAVPVELTLSPLHTADGVFVFASTVSAVEEPRAAGARAALAERLAFERFVADLSAKFINVTCDEIAGAIRDGLGRACELVGLDRATFQQVEADGTLADRAEWTTPGVLVPAATGAARRRPWSLERIARGATLVFASLDEIPVADDRAAWQAAGIRSAVVVPLLVEGRLAGAVEFATVRAERHWTGDLVHRLTVIASVFGEVLARQRRDAAVQAAAAEAQRLREQLQVENGYLRQEARERLGMTRVVGQSAAVRRVLEQVEQVAATDATVLLLGETGTGKELFATQIHEHGPRQRRPMVRVNCAAIPTTLVESELFGREKGAFTGALARQVGRFELAHHSTIFLDEIGDLPPDVQVKLLRVLEEGQIERLGSPRSLAVDTRVIAATHRNLEQRIADGTFREDLYYRLNVFPIHVPPLRERVEDIPLLVWRFVEEFSKAFGRRVDTIEQENLAALARYPWPGNIRELRNVVERAMIVSTGGRKLSIPVPLASVASTRRSTRLADVEKEHIRAVLESTAWRIRGPGGAAERLGLKPTTLETRMVKLGVRRPGLA